MKKLLVLFALFISFSAYSQTTVQDTPTDTTQTETKKNFGSKIGKLFGYDAEKELEELNSKIKTQKVIIDSIALELTKKPKVVVKQVTVPTLNENAVKSIKKDEQFVDKLPKSYTNINSKDISNLTKQIDSKIEYLIKQRDSILKAGGNTELVDAKNNIIKSLQREKSVIHLSEESNQLKDKNSDLKDQNVDLKESESKLKKYLYTALGFLLTLILVIAVILQRKRINVQDVEIEKQLSDINKKNNYLEHAARIIRHDMHSGINTYIPRGINSLEKRINEDQAKELKIDGSIKMIKEGLNHTQKVYKSVYEFTNLVKQDVVLDRKVVNLKDTLSDYISSTAYGKNVELGDLVEANVNPSLFCTAIDNLVRNGLNFNSSETKLVKIYMDGSNLVIEDNGKGLSKSKFEKIKKKKQSDGLGLIISLAIIEEHGFELICEQIPTGTKMIITLK